MVFATCSPETDTTVVWAIALIALALSRQRNRTFTCRALQTTEPRIHNLTNETILSEEWELIHQAISYKKIQLRNACSLLGVVRLFSRCYPLRLNICSHSSSSIRNTTPRFAICAKLEMSSQALPKHHCLGARTFRHREVAAVSLRRILWRRHNGQGGARFLGPMYLWFSMLAVNIKEE